VEHFLQGLHLIGSATCRTIAPTRDHFAKVQRNSLCLHMGIRLQKNARAREQNANKARSSKALSKSDVVDKIESYATQTNDQFEQTPGTQVGVQSASVQKSKVPMALQLKQLQATLDTPVPRKAGRRLCARTLESFSKCKHTKSPRLLTDRRPHV